MSILLVEDDRDLAELWCEYLRARGHQPRVAHSVAEGLAELSDQIPDLLIVDYTLGDGTAAHLLDRATPLFTDHRPAIWVCSGHGRDLPSTITDRITGVLAKPFRLEQLDELTKPYRPKEPSDDHD